MSEENKKEEDKIVVKKKKKVFSKKCKNCDKNETEMEEYKSGWLRAQADYKNLQKEISEQRGQWAQMSEQTILEEFIPVYDNFKLAFGHEIANITPELENWKKGIEYIMKQFGKVLEDHGVVEIRTVGELFNEEMHEAVEEQESDEDSGRILREVHSGYTMKDKVIKVAKVVVSK
jgi:molecular chaperone GrpE